MQLLRHILLFCLQSTFAQSKKLGDDCGLIALDKKDNIARLFKNKRYVLWCYHQQ